MKPWKRNCCWMRGGNSHPAAIGLSMPGTGVPKRRNTATDRCHTIHGPADDVCLIKSLLHLADHLFQPAFICLRKRAQSTVCIHEDLECPQGYSLDFPMLHVADGLEAHTRNLLDDRSSRGIAPPPEHLAQLDLFRIRNRCLSQGPSILFRNSNYNLIPVRFICK